MNFSRRCSFSGERYEKISLSRATITVFLEIFPIVISGLSCENIYFCEEPSVNHQKIMKFSIALLHFP